MLGHSEILRSKLVGVSLLFTSLQLAIGPVQDPAPIRRAAENACNGEKDYGAEKHQEKSYHCQTRKYRQDSECGAFGEDRSPDDKNEN